MRFGEVPITQAAGTILAHSVAVQQGRLRKGQVLEVAHIARLRAAGIETVTVARLDAGDCHEDTAARDIAAALMADPGGDGLWLSRAFTGRVNVFAHAAGVVDMKADQLYQLNRVNPLITVATVPEYQQMAKGGMVATVKIISYAVPEADVARAVAHARGAMRLARPVYRNASLIITEIPGGPGKKGRKAIEDRLAALEITLVDTQTVPHDAAALAEAIAVAQGEMILILTGSATSDLDDVAPSALRAAGGRVKRFGIPVDPGNLLFTGKFRKRPVIGLPGCARSPALNGADWVLSRMACGIDVGNKDIAAMGVGGLLKEMPSRPMPRKGRKGGVS
ncbi:MAG: molybdopterin biosynthesis protein [Rhodobacterales bacterium]|nr:MAG: molybdopterin biosynthesis protein [Rhodobacterales bacterium]